ncbi:hypothetical protein Pstr01_22220 [Pseudomonas straminea]|uniref:Uncharacterized protein n=1 Tax=Pseudomonas straminea TaxID=47882 RepID=A0A1I1UA87_PSEOC|nr:hypothetical protein [Pseudomonas straminea]GLX13983.1 hypothetical protein Pstr01_22220 [Pseudomonas straminea]SFD67604.1 hypothetical protein SAMN05216372_103182 [Pseudomonas straminea]
MHSREVRGFRRLQTFCNLILLVLQLITVAAYWGLVDARPQYMAISEGLYPDSELLMNSQIAEWMVSMPAFLAVAALFLGGIAKEFIGISKGRRILINLALLILLVAMFGIAAFPLSPNV